MKSRIDIDKYTYSGLTIYKGNYYNDKSFYVGFCKDTCVGSCFIAVSEDEVKNIEFYSIYELENLVSQSKSSIEITKKQLYAGDYVIGIDSLSNTRHIYPGLYIGKKQVYIGVDKKVSCQLVYKIDECFYTEMDKAFVRKIKRLYQEEQSKIIMDKSKPLIFNYNLGDILSNTKSSVSLYLGEKYTNNGIVHIYINFKLGTRGQTKFYQFLTNNLAGSFELDKTILVSRLTLYDMSLKSIVLIILNGLGGTLSCYKTKKGFRDILFNININKFIDNDLSFIDENCSIIYN